MKKVSVLFILTLVTAGCQITSLNQTVSGTITMANSLPDGEWRAHVFYIPVTAGVPYYFELESPTADTVGIWSPDAWDFILEVSPVVTKRYTTYTFESGGLQKLIVETIADDVPSDYIFTVSD